MDGTLATTAVLVGCLAYLSASRPGCVSEGVKKGLFLLRGLGSHQWHQVLTCESKTIKGTVNIRPQKYVFQYNGKTEVCRSIYVLFF